MQKDVKVMNGPKRADFRTIYRRYKGVFVGGFLLLLFASISIGAQSIQLLVIAKIDATFWPTVVGILGCILSAALIVQSYIIGKKITVMEENETYSSQERGDKWNDEGNLRTIFTFILLFLYVLGIFLLGWIISTLLYLFFQFSILTEKEKRKPIRIAILTVVFTTLVYIFFRYVFLLMLPVGILWSSWG
jgi:hypothetical protein